MLETVKSGNLKIAGVGSQELGRHTTVFMNALDHAFSLAQQGISQRDKNPLFWNLRDAFVTKDTKGLHKEILYSFQAFIIRQQTTQGLETSKRRIVDFRYPHEWYPETRCLQRTIHIHVGPTNSGKTYKALQALEKCKTGVYCGPLRLLAAEVYQRFVSKGRAVALVTGEEVRIPANTDQYITACTVEMVTSKIPYDVAVIDEIQMLGDRDRGSAWTNALLGVQAKEVHVCGEERAVNLIKSLIAPTGDKIVVHKYKRLSPLEVMKKPINGFKDLTKGDAIVAFSRKMLHVLRKRVENDTGRRCAIIYGGLPPEVRVQQAALFNDPDNDYDFLVASDAIGMGLNLEVRRIIMESTSKFDGGYNRFLSHPEIKQIGGRAGRYKTARGAAVVDAGGIELAKPETSLGLVTAMEQSDLKVIQKAFGEDVPDMTTAYIAPNQRALEYYTSFYPPGTPLSYLFMQIKTTAITAPGFRIAVSNDILEIADLIQDLPLSNVDRLKFCKIPNNMRSTKGKQVLRAYARIIAENRNISLLDVTEIPLETLDIEGFNPQDPLMLLNQFEELHMSILQYQWLSYRFEGVFLDRDLAFHINDLVQQRLMHLLSKLSLTAEQLRQARQLKYQVAQRQTSKLKERMEESAEEDEADEQEEANVRKADLSHVDGVMETEPLEERATH